MKGCVCVFGGGGVVTILKSHKLKNKMGTNIFLILIWQFRIYAYSRKNLLQKTVKYN